MEEEDDEDINKKNEKKRKIMMLMMMIVVVECLSRRAVDGRQWCWCIDCLASWLEAAARLWLLGHYRLQSFKLAGFV